MFLTGKTFAATCSLPSLLSVVAVAVEAAEFAPVGAEVAAVAAEDGDGAAGAEFHDLADHPIATAHHLSLPALTHDAWIVERVLGVTA
jgi:hypothetical protein